MQLSVSHTYLTLLVIIFHTINYIKISFQMKALNRHGYESIRHIMTTSMLFFVAEQHDIEGKTILCGVSSFQFSLI